MRWFCRLTVVGAFLLLADVGAIAIALSDEAIDRALKLAQAPGPRRAQFHAPYLVLVNDAVVEQIEVVTEFRRCVLIAEEQLRMGNWLFAQGVRGAKEKLRPYRDRVSLVARLRFHPQNVIAGLPPYDITIGPDLVPLDVVRTPITALLSGRPGDFNAPLMGATIEAVFDAGVVGRTARPVSVSLAARAVAGATIDFAKLD